MRGRPRILVNQFGGFGGYDLESLGSMAFPGAVEYSKATVSVLNKIGFDSDFARTMLSPPMQSQLNGLIVAIESTANALIKDVSAALESGGKSLLAEGKKLLAEGKGVLTDFKTATGIDAVKLAGSLANMLQSIVAGDVKGIVRKGVDIAVDVGMQLLTKLAPQLLDMIPVIGALISGVVQGIFALIDAFKGPSAEEIKAATEEAEGELTRRLQQECPKISQEYSPRSTGMGGATAADLFRDVYIAATIGDFLPPTTASIYVLLCGGESQGVGPTRNEYNLWLNKVRKLKGGSKIGIEPSIQRTMWELIKAIMSSTKSPVLREELDTHGDQGRSAMALLQEIIRKEYFAGTWTKESVNSISRFLSERFRFAQPIKTGGRLVKHCGGYMGLHHAFEDAQINWQNSLTSFCAEGGAVKGGCKKWNSTPTAAMLAKVRSPSGIPKGVLTLSRHSAEVLTKSVMPNLRGKELADAKIAVGSVGSLAPVGLVLAGAAAVYAFSSLRSKGVS